MKKKLKVQNFLIYMVTKMEKKIIDEKIRKIIGDSRFNQISNCCYLCGEDNPFILRKIEKHHIDGRKNSDEVVPLCPNCHTKITFKQNSISPIKRKSTSNIDKLCFRLISNGSLLEIIGHEQVKIGRLIIENGSISKSIN